MNSLSTQCRSTGWLSGFILITTCMLLCSTALAGTKHLSSSATALSAAGMAAAVNPDSNSVTLVDVSTLTVKAEITVGTDPRTVSFNPDGTELYTANRGESTVSVVDLATMKESRKIQTGARPYGVLADPNGDRIYVAEQGADSIRIVNTADYSTAAVISTSDKPSGLAVSADGTKLYVTHLLTAFVSVYTVRPQINETPQTLSLWPDSNLVQSAVFLPGGEALFFPHTRSRVSNMNLTFDTTVFPVVTPIDLTTGYVDGTRNLALDTADMPVGLPFDVDFSADGKTSWIVNAGSNDVSVVDLASKSAVAHIEVQDNPRGIVLTADGSKALVNNVLAGMLSIIDTATYAVTNLSLTNIPLPPLLLDGKKLFFSSDDVRLSKDQWISCNTCHFDTEHDGRTWVFGFAGPRNTTGLQGMIKTYPLRWSGEWDESADGEFAIRRENFGSGLIDGEIHCELYPADCLGTEMNQGRSYELDALAAYMDSLTDVPLSPGHIRGEPLTAAELRGKALFEKESLGCITCHPPPHYTDHKSHDVGTTTSNEVIGPAFDTPTLLGLYDSAPYYHDGSSQDLEAALTRSSPKSEHDLSGTLSESERADLIAYLLALPYE